MKGCRTNKRTERRDVLVTDTPEATQRTRMSTDEQCGWRMEDD